MTVRKLVLAGNGRPQKDISLPIGPIFIGRDPKSEIILTDPQVSWRHACVTTSADDCEIEDLNSTNGTYVGEKRISRLRLRNGDTITVGPYRITFIVNADSPSAATSSEQTLSVEVNQPSDRLAPDDEDITQAHPAITVRAGKDQSVRSFYAKSTRLFPVLSWLPSYRREYLKGDLTAGITVAMMLIPQGMAYALLAGLPPVMGLYASMLPMILYAFLGTSRQVSVGPVALDSILIAVGIGTLAEAGTEAYITLAILLAASVGVIQLVMGIVRLGFLVNFLSYPVLCGFSTAAALITAISQLKHLVGVTLTQAYDLTTIISGLYAQRAEISLVTLIIGTGAIVFMIVIRRQFPRIPGPLSVVVLGILLVWALNLDTVGVKIVGEVPSGLPSLALPIPEWSMIGSLLPLALTLALVGFAQTISIAKSLAHKQGYDIDANQELIGLGIANLGSSLTQGYSVSGGLSRSAVNARAGAHTPLAAVLTSMFIGVTLVYLTPLIFNLPKAVLAAIILVSAVGLIDMREIRYLFRVKKTEGALLVFTFITTLSVGITFGLLFGIIASILLFVILNTRPHAAILGRLPGTNIFRNVTDFSEAETIDGLVILRIDASFYFANSEFLKAKAREIRQQYGDALKAIILDASAINDLDSSADTALHQISVDFKHRKIEFYIAGVKGPVRKVMKRSGLYDVLGGDHFFFTIDAAVKRYLRTNAKHPLSG